MTVTRTQTEQVERVLGACCARNASAELHYEKRDGTIIVARMRLLALTAEYLLTDEPVFPDGRVQIPEKEKVTVCLMVDGQRFRFQSRIEEGGQLIPLNSQKMVRGVALLRPQVVEEAQRRHHLRISLVGLDPVRVGLIRPHPGFPGACPIDAKPKTGRLADISAGGASVLISRRALAKINRGESFFLSFELPWMDELFHMLASVRHYVMVERSDSHRVGLSFLDWGERRLALEQQRLAHFVARMERRMLQRRR